MKTTAGTVAILAMLGAAPVMVAAGDTPGTTSGPAAGSTTSTTTGNAQTTRTDNARASSTEAEHSGVGGGAPGAMGKQGTESGQAPRPSTSGGYPAEHK